MGSGLFSLSPTRFRTVFSKSFDRLLFSAHADLTKGGDRFMSLTRPAVSARRSLHQLVPKDHAQ
ncbi:hypothetical protein NS226_19165 [Aureimonas ureilytica]|uniref:Uncharacterized protein n=1 Tax=Aureimonas ureilytica TaxID=401562 RepID=A0A175R427_9HYPH|nr:hypothetical protein NS226_19165 [Aureimonas ureilytica]